ncbi:transglutaminase [Kineococcus sp. R8]|nr:transglutaminase [Kineococcus siccus]
MDLTADAATPASLLLAVARRDGVDVLTESLTVTGPDGPVAVTEVDAGDGTRLHEVLLPRGATTVRYAAEVRSARGEAPGLTDLERWALTRPSRYAPSDRLSAVAAAEFGGVDRAGLPRAVASWVHEHLAYVSGSSAPTDTAVETLLARQGVCRDFAHLTTTFLRALDVPARLCAVYAPGLSPMDFHAVVEAAPEDAWEVVDATRLAPRQALVRIATGRDAADTAFLTTAGPVTLTSMEVLAVVAGDLPVDGLAPGVPLP